MSLPTPIKRPQPRCCNERTRKVRRRIGSRFLCGVCKKLFYRDPYVEYV